MDIMIRINKMVMTLKTIMIMGMNMMDKIMIKRTIIKNKYINPQINMVNSKEDNSSSRSNFNNNSMDSIMMFLFL